MQIVANYGARQKIGAAEPVWMEPPVNSAGLLIAGLLFIFVGALLDGAFFVENF